MISHYYHENYRDFYFAVVGRPSFLLHALAGLFHVMTYYWHENFRDLNFDDPCFLALASHYLCDYLLR